jgi:hypothetical protein
MLLDPLPDKLLPLFTSLPEEGGNMVALKYRQHMKIREKVPNRT